MLTIGLLNNMPPAAIASTERHFHDVLTVAANGTAFAIRWFRLTGAKPAHYDPLEALWGGRLDGLIITGAEPRAESLKDEPFWPALVKTIDWAKTHTVSTIFSCLAAHAAVLYLDGVERRPHIDKIFGVFDSVQVGQHALLTNLAPVWSAPHSRWNDLQESDLVASGYTVLAKTKDAGVDLFIKQLARSLFVFIQTHPEYDVDTLMREYRRDISRHDSTKPYPLPPKNYFDAASLTLLESIQDRSHGLAILEKAILPVGTWNETAIGLYRNWFTHLESHRSHV